MLNMKKGLAIVLAAATAFTFAPVASLSSAVTAFAASDYTATADKSATTKTASVDVELPAGQYVLVVNKKASENNGVAVKVGTKGETGTALDVFYTDSSSYNKSVKVLNDTKATTFEFNATSATANGTFTYSIKKVKNVDSTTGNASVESDSFTTTAGTVKTIDLTVKGVAVPTIKDVTADGDTTVYGTTYHNVNQGETLDLDFSSAVTTDGTNSASAGTNYAADGFTYETDGLISVSDKSSSDLAKNGKISVKGLAVGTSVLKVSVKKADGSVYATGEFKIKVNSTSAHISSFTWSDPATGKTAYLSGTTKPVVSSDSDLANASGSSSVVLDPLVNKTLQLNVTADSALTYVSGDKNVLTVSSTGLITAVKAGITTVKVYAASDLGNPKTLNVTVTDKSKDSLSIKYNGSAVDATNGVNLDPSTSTAATAVKSAQLETTSKAGLAVNYLIVFGNGVTSAGDSTIATVNASGVITAGTKTGTVYVYAYTNDSGNIAGDHEWVKVTVNALPQADITVTDPVVLDLKDHKTAELDAKSSVKDVVFSYNADADALNAVSIVGNAVTAKKIGKGKITVTATATKTTRLTKKDITVSVVENAEKKVSDIKAAASTLTIKVGDTASAGVTATVESGAAISYKSDDESVATVASNGAITAKAPGVAIITATAPESKTMNAGIVTIKVIVPANPAKVTGVKVSNKKGAKVSVKWTAQNGNVSYRIYKKVGSGKWVAKNVTSNKATLSVKKGAKVTVKVKAFVKGTDGKTVWGPKATQAKAFKTDKK